MKGFCSMKVVHEDFTSMFKLSREDFHGWMNIYENFLLGFWEKIYVDQEHELVFGVGTINLAFEPLNKMDIWEMVWFWKIGKLFLVCSWEI